MYDLRGLVIVQYVVSGLPPSTHKPVTCVEQTMYQTIIPRYNSCGKAILYCCFSWTRIRKVASGAPTPLLWMKFQLGCIGSTYPARGYTARKKQVSGNPYMYYDKFTFVLQVSRDGASLTSPEGYSRAGPLESQTSFRRLSWQSTGPF